MSSTLPSTTALEVIDCAKPILLVLIPTEKESVRFTIELLSPDTDITSLSFNSINGK